MTAFDRHDFNAFPVVDDEGRLAGIVTKRDVLRLFRPFPGLRIPPERTIASVPVDAIMRRGVVNVEAHDPLVTAAELMVATDPRIVTQGDLLPGLRFELAERGAVNTQVE